MTSEPTRPGRLVDCPEGYRAFVPDPLPPSFDWTSELVRLLSEADRTLGELAREGGRLPNPHLLMRPFVRREAVLSSRIEGTQATLGDLLADEAGTAAARAPDDLREVANYVVALDYGIERLAEGDLTLTLVREIHARLMEGVHGNRATPGEFRSVQNWIGGPRSSPATASYVPPPPEALARTLNEWESFLGDAPLPPLVQVALLHYQFEAIHPFLDGNGRVGRLIITLFLMAREVLPTPLLYLSAWFEATRWDYYRHLRDVSERGAWHAWLAYFLTGVAQQAADALDRAERVNVLLTRWRDTLGATPSRVPTALIDLLAENPFCTIKRTAARLGIAFTTAQRAIERLEHAGILTPTTAARRNRVWCARAMLEVLEGE